VRLSFVAVLSGIDIYCDEPFNTKCPPSVELYVGEPTKVVCTEETESTQFPLPLYVDGSSAKTAPEVKAA
jgi:hypothetical protein